MSNFNKKRETKMNYQERIMTNILKLLNIRGINQAEISRRTGIDKSTVSKLFSGETQLKINTLSEISTAIDVPVVDIITFPEKFERVSSAGEEPAEVIVQLKLKKEKKDQVLKLLYGENNIEIFNK